MNLYDVGTYGFLIKVKHKPLCSFLENIDVNWWRLANLCGLLNKCTLLHFNLQWNINICPSNKSKYLEVYLFTAGSNKI